MSALAESTPQPRPKDRRVEMAALFALRQRERLTWRQLSSRSGIPVATLTSWQQKIHKEARPRPAFVEVAAAPAAPRPAAAFTLELGDGLRVQVPAAFDADSLLRLLGVLGAC